MLSEATVLELWTNGHGLGAFARGNLLAASVASGPVDELTVGQRNACLLEVYLRTGGTDLLGAAACPACGEAVEFAVPATAVLDTGNAVKEPVFSHGGERHSFRTPRIVDLGGPRAARDAAELVRRCLEHPVDEPLLADPGFLAAFSEALAASDPLADLRAELLCVACAHRWIETVDPGRFAWQRVEHLAVGLLETVRALASAYGWTEREILSLPPARRRYYADGVSA